MWLTLDSIQNKFIKRVIQHFIYLIVVVVFIPAFYFFELYVVLPAVVEEWTVAYYIHFSLGHFLLLNIIGNMIFGMFTNTSTSGRMLNNYSKADWGFCEVCEYKRPPRAWHCSTCNTCILKRDHHCIFFACCIGYYNHRYFILFTFYVFVSMIYAFYYNVQFLYQFLTWNHGLLLLKLFVPIASALMGSENDSLYVGLVVVNIIMALFTGFLFIYHFRNILKGKITPENKANNEEYLYDMGWKLNIVEVFGQNWYLTWIWPFVKSPLPGDGIEWHVSYKQK